MASKNKSSSSRIKKIFKDLLFWGIISLLTSALISVITDGVEYVQNNVVLKSIVNIIIALNSFGAGSIIGYLIDVGKGTEEYLDLIKKQLKETIIAKEFIKDLSKEEKSDIIRKCLSDVSSKELDSYINYKTNQMYGLCNALLRSNIDYVTTAYKDPSTKKLYYKQQ